MLATILSRFSQSPVMIADSAETTFLTNFQVAQDKIDAFDAKQKREMYSAEQMYDHDFWPEAGSFLARLRPYDVLDGTLVIPVHGSLVRDLGMTLCGAITGYKYLQKAVERGMDDEQVDRIIFDHNSPGGEVSGNFDLVDFIASQRGRKPMIAAANDHSYSASYNIAAAADEIVVDRVGGTGSVGVLTMHVSMAEWLKNAGLEVTYVFAGERKVDGNPTQQLSERAEKRIQTRIDSMYDMFVSTVANNRNISEQSVRDTEAMTLMAEESVELGFADRVQSFNDLLAAYTTESAPSQGDIMSEKQKPGEQASGAEGRETSEKARQEGFEAGKAEGNTEGRAAERARVNGIINAEEAGGKPQTALNLALHSDMSLENAKSFLKAQPNEAQGSGSQSGSHFNDAMGQDNPDLSAGTDDPSKEAGAESDASRIVATQRNYTGRSAEQ